MKILCNNLKLFDEYDSIGAEVQFPTISQITSKRREKVRERNHFFDVLASISVRRRTRPGLVEESMSKSGIHRHTLTPGLGNKKKSRVVISVRHLIVLIAFALVNDVVRTTTGWLCSKRG